MSTVDEKHLERLVPTINKASIKYNHIEHICAHFSRLFFLLRVFQNWELTCDSSSIRSIIRCFFLPYFVGRRHFFCKYFCVQIKKYNIIQLLERFHMETSIKTTIFFYTNTFMHICCFSLLVKSPFACVFITSLCLVYSRKKMTV